MSHKSRVPATERGNTSKPQQGGMRRIEQIDRVENPPLEKTDRDRKSLVSKVQRGSVRVCKGCGAVSERKRWTLDSARREQALAEGRPIEETLCPGCERLHMGRVDGFVELRGPVVAEKTHEIKRTIDHIVEEAREDDPVHHIASYTVMEDRVALETTSMWLAETIGKAINRQYRGELRIQFSPGASFVRVYWEQR